MSVKIDSAATSDDYSAACTIEDQWLSSGGYFIISGAEVYAQLQYSQKEGPQGYGQWGTEVHVPTGNGQIFKGTTGIRFRSFTAGTPATISAAIFSRDEPTFIIGSGGISSVAGGNLQVQHNGTLVGTEPALDFEDALGFVWTISDDTVNSRIQATPPAIPKLIAYQEWTGNITIPAATQIVSSGAIAYDGSEIEVEFYCPQVQMAATAGNSLIVSLRDSGTDIGRIGIVRNPAAAAMNVPLLLKRRFTPSVATHTYQIYGEQTSGNPVVSAAAGGAGSLMPGYIKICTVAGA